MVVVREQEERDERVVTGRTRTTGGGARNVAGDGRGRGQV